MEEEQVEMCYICLLIIYNECNHYVPQTCTNRHFKNLNKILVECVCYQGVK